MWVFESTEILEKAAGSEGGEKGNAIRDRQIVKLRMSGMDLRESKIHEWSSVFPTAVAKVIHMYLPQHEECVFIYLVGWCTFIIRNYTPAPTWFCFFGSEW